MMQFLKQNIANTTTLFSITSGTTSVANLIDRKSDLIWQSSGENSDLTTSTIRIGWTTDQEIDRIILQNINLKSFNLYYNSNSANLFSLTSSATGTSNFSNNSDTSLYLQLEATKTITVLTIEMTSTMVANEEKKIGEIWVCKSILEFSQDPKANNYKPKQEVKEFSHEMSDGGNAVYHIADRFSAKIKREYVPTSEFANIRAMKNLHKPLVFVPFPTSTAWQDQEEQVYEVNWIGDLAYDYTDNYKPNGRDVNMDLRETTK